MTNSAVYSLIPNKKITLTVNSVNINKPAVSAGFINLMYIWQYQSKWLKLGKFASNNNWVDLVDYRGEKTTGKFIENEPIVLNYYAVFGYKVDFRLVIYSLNSKKLNVISKNSLNCYQQAIISNLIQTICNDDKNVKLNLKSSNLVINQTIKLANFQTIDFFVEVDDNTIYENNQTSDKKSSSVRIIFELNNKKDNNWKEIGNFPLLFQNHIMQPISLPISFDQVGNYVVRAKIALERSWQIAPIFSNEIKVVLNNNTSQINFDLLKRMVEYPINSFFNSILLTNSTIKQINNIKLNWFKWQLTSLSNGIDTQPIIIQKFWINQIISNNELNHIHFYWTLFLGTSPIFFDIYFLIIKSARYKVNYGQLKENRNLVIAYPSNNFNSTFWGLVVNINNDTYPLINIINNLINSHPGIRNIEKNIAKPCGKIVSFANYLNSSFFLANSWFTNMNDFSLFNLVMLHATNESNLSFNFIDYRKIPYVMINLLWINKNLLHHQQLTNWKITVENSLLSQVISHNDNLNLSNLNMVSFNWIKIIEHPSNFLLMFPLSDFSSNFVNLFNLSDGDCLTNSKRISLNNLKTKIHLIFPDTYNYYQQLTDAMQVYLLAINFLDFFKD